MAEGAAVSFSAAGRRRPRQGRSLRGPHRGETGNQPAHGQRAHAGPLAGRPRPRQEDQTVDVLQARRGADPRSQAVARPDLMSGGGMREVISTTGAPGAIGPFSQAIRAGGFVFVSGQVGLDPATGKVVPGDVSAQTERVLENLSAILAAAGTELPRFVRAGVFLRNMDDFAAMNAVYARWFPDGPPARTTVQAARLPLDVLVEIDAIALA